uniref:Uncharacterized protein n=1 Tax=Ananas comosus var. bracteatus TaxID=296719 RepID=A0A6V7Q6F7_ANACO|nr:unnamed protein product [Ananas comosus var. bracteatus]
MSHEKKGEDEGMELRRGPWTLQEDTLLTHYIACHGEGRWNLLARSSGLKRTGKSCRLRWLNYLKPDIKRGNLSPEEQLIILELHSKWGNRWSRIAQYLPGRTDNEIKNYWRTRVQRQARQLNVDANSATFHDAVRCYWMPMLVEKMSSSSPSPGFVDPNTPISSIRHDIGHLQGNQQFFVQNSQYPYEDLLSYALNTALRSASASASAPASASMLSGYSDDHHPSYNAIPYSSSGVDSVGNCVWGMDQLCFERKLNEWGGYI